MKNTILIFGFFALLFSACSDEFEKVDEEINYPDTEILVNADLKGVITDVDGELLNDITVDILVDGYLLASTKTNNGDYAFLNQPSHKTNTIIRAHSKSYAPNFTSVNIDGAGATIEQNMSVGKFLKTQNFESDQAINFAGSSTFNGSFAANSFENTTSVLLGAQVYPTATSTADLISIRTAVDANGNEKAISLDQVHYIGAYDLSDDAVIVKTTTDFNVQFPQIADATLYAFNIELGKWQLVTNYQEENGLFNITTNEPTYYASVSSNCQNDITPPVVVAHNLSTFVYDPAATNTLYAADLDNGSWDDCTASNDLIMEVKKETDVCNNGSDVFASTIEFCAAEVGTIQTVVLSITDESGNSNTVLTDVRVTGDNAGCAGDVTPPIPVCYNELTVDMPFGSAILKASDIDAGSYDNCATTLTFEAKKLTDICNNGSDEFGDTVTFCAQEAGTQVTVRMKVTDTEGNSDYCDVTVNVAGNDCNNDTTPPVVVVVQTSTFILGGTNLLHAEDLDNGSYDFCSTVLIFEIRKESDVCANGSDVAGDTIEFCSAEAGSDVRVFTIVTDEAGNFNESWTTVRVSN